MPIRRRPAFVHLPPPVVRPAGHPAIPPPPPGTTVPLTPAHEALLEAQRRADVLAAEAAARRVLGPDHQPVPPVPPPLPDRELVPANPRVTQPRDVADIKAGELTFGVEIECAIPQGPMAQAGWVRGGYHGSPNLHEHRGWRCGSDGSITPPGGAYGVELSSGILRGLAGLISVEQVCLRLQAMQTTVNHTCGFHVHVGWPEAAGIIPLRRLLSLFANHERGLFAITGSIRREHGTFSRPIKDALRRIHSATTVREIVALNPPRYHALNIANLIGRGRGLRTVEFRLFTPTTQVRRAHLFIQVALGLVHKALDTKSEARWDSPARQPARRVGTHEALRLFNALGWVKGKQRKSYGLLQESDRIVLLNEALKLTVRYDQKRELWLAQGGAATQVDAVDAPWTGELS
jgi:Putative amidoligase enzyme